MNDLDLVAFRAAQRLASRCVQEVGDELSPGDTERDACQRMAVWLRDLALIALMALVVREVLRPEEDVVRADGADDPAGGVLDGAEDRWERPAPSARPAPA